jgi:hypothetical protein
MGILSGDVKLVASQVMNDVPEGGGAPVATIIQDGTSNAIFPDISELDRAGGRVNLRKVFGSIQTNSVDGYFGANVIVADPPDDPNVSITLFSTEDVFDRRSSAQSRMESYLAQGTVSQSLLFGNHISGQLSIALLQRTTVALPVVGDTLLLRKDEGLSTQTEQFVRITNVTATQRTFTDTQGDFVRTEVTLGISDSLRADFAGFDAVRQDSSINYTGKTKVYSTIVADAARYYGVVKVEEDASIGDFTIKAEGIFTQLVPSTRVEVPIADARMNQQSVMLVEAGSALTQNITAIFTTAQALYIGGSILPGSLSIVRSSLTVTDLGGVLMQAGNQVGLVDYSNGILTLSTNVFGTSSGTHVVTYTPATEPAVVTETLGLPVTQEGQRLSYVFTLDPLPAKKTLQVSYLALGRWYVLTEDGSGAIRGADSSYGAGTINFTTGTVSLTLGALPDVDSQVIFEWSPAVVSRPVTVISASSPSAVRVFGKKAILTNTVKPGSLTLTWNDGSSRSSTDSNGTLIGDATGTIDYGSGRLVFRPNALPAPNTTINVAVTNATAQAGNVPAFVDGGSSWTFTLTAPVKARSVEFAVLAQYPMRIRPETGSTTETTLTQSLRVFDDGSGNLQIANITGNLTIGSINYSTGAGSINKSVSGFNSEQPKFQDRTPLGAISDPSSYIKLVGYEVLSLNLTLLNGPGSLLAIPRPSWAWWAGGSQGTALEYRYAGSDGSGDSYSFTFDAVTLPIGDLYANSAVAISLERFTLGSSVYHLNKTTLNYEVNTNPATGVGTVVGSRVIEEGIYAVRLTTWTTGVSPTPGSISGSSVPDIAGSETPLLVDSAYFRTAVAPLVNGGFSVAGTFSDGTTFTASADSDGIISSGSVVVGSTPGSYGVFGTVNYETGVVALRFGRRIPVSMESEDDVVNVSTLGLSGITYLGSRGVRADTLRYNAVGYSYLPLDADILGLDPVRLPADGRVPIFRPGSFAVVGNTDTVGPQTVSNGQTIDCGRVRLSRVRVIGDDGLVINTGYTTDLEAGTVTFTSVSGYSQPVTVEHRVEDLMLVSDAQINGQLTFTRAMTHNYPADTSYVSSALIAGDLQARVSVLFDQATWSNVFSDSVSGSSATGTFNDIAHPIQVSNIGALTERWAVVFTNTTTFNVIGEHVGVIGSGNTSLDFSVNNPATGQPYFTIPSVGWGTGWAAGNALRFNTVGAFFPVWVARTILQGPATVTDDSFTLLIRGDVDNP